MPAPVIEVEGLSKTYRVYRRPWDRLRERVVGRRCHTPVDALSDVAFSLEPGQGLGVIGENGAGKSTLLQLLSGVLTATRGRVETRGRVASILELGSSFHPEFTGRQNILLNCALLGLDETEARERLDRIERFSELGDFLQQPVKRYSTGMAMRLGFSIAIEVEPEILIVDEALSVGDGYFQKKCMDRMSAFIESGRTMVLSSHAMYCISAFCPRTLWLRRGRPEALGKTEQVIASYQGYLLDKARTPEHPAERRRADDDDAAGPARLLAAALQTDTYEVGDRWSLELAWESDRAGRAFHLGVVVERSDGIPVCSFATQEDGIEPLTGSTHYQARLLVPSLPLTQGEFSVQVLLMDEAGLHIFDKRVIDRAFHLEGRFHRPGLLVVPHEWELGDR